MLNNLSFLGHQLVGILCKTLLMIILTDTLKTIQINYLIQY